jgi:hypothetical protein
VFAQNILWRSAQTKIHTKDLCNQRRVHFAAGNSGTYCKLTLPVKLPLLALPVSCVFARRSTAAYGGL